jgi:hypothetical protein
MIIDALQDRIDNLFDYLAKVFVLVLSIFIDARLIFHAILFLIVIDQIMGVTYAVVKKCFSLKIFSKVFLKVLLYMSVIMSTFIYEKYLLNGADLYFTKIIAALVGFKELSSSYQKFVQLTGIELFESILNKIKG